MTVVRRAESEDAAEIARVMLAAFEEFRSLFTPAAFVATAIPADGVRERIRAGPVWVAAHATRRAPTMRAWVKAAVMPLSLKEPEGFMPSYCR